jgi:hypothetical protein
MYAEAWSGMAQFGLRGSATMGQKVGLSNGGPNPRRDQQESSSRSIRKRICKGHGHIRYSDIKQLLHLRALWDLRGRACGFAVHPVDGRVPAKQCGGLWPLLQPRSATIALSMLETRRRADCSARVPYSFYAKTAEPRQGRESLEARIFAISSDDSLRERQSVHPKKGLVEVYS